MPIRDAYPYLCVRDAAAALEFYSRVFGAQEVMRLTDSRGRVAHAELKFGPALLMIADEHPEYGVQSPLAFGGTGTTIHLHVDDVDTLTARAREAGATVLREPTDQGHGERQSRVRRGPSIRARVRRPPPHGRFAVPAWLRPVTLGSHPSSMVGHPFWRLAMRLRFPCTSVRRFQWRVGALVALAALAACGADTAGPGAVEGPYELHRLNGEVLPYDREGLGCCTYLSGTLTLEGAGYALDDLAGMTREQLIDEIRKLRRGIRSHRDSTGHDLCWHHPKLWGLLPKREDPQPVVPDWPEFLRGCVRYRQSLDEQAPEAPRSS